MKLRKQSLEDVLASWLAAWVWFAAWSWFAGRCWSWLAAWSWCWFAAGALLVEEASGSGGRKTDSNGNNCHGSD